jgi:hypothetical protein
VGLGLEAAEAIRITRAARPGAVETSTQEKFVTMFADAWRTAPPVIPSASRFVGCLLGGALGDALGYPVEFAQDVAVIEGVLGVLPPACLPSFQGTRGVVSDDTQMTLFTAEGLVRAQCRFVDRGICSPAAVLQGAYP